MPDPHRERQFAEILFGRLGIEPLNVLSGERPDLRFEFGSKRVGMEITECTPEEYYRGSKIANGLGGPIVYSISHLGEPESRRKNPELFHDMFNRPDYVDMNVARREWCDRLQRRIVGKREKLPGFEQFDENWLLVWDNIGLSDDASTLLEIQPDMLATPFGAAAGETDFHHIYVLSGDYTFDIVPGKIAFLHEKATEVNAWLESLPKDAET